MSEKKFPLVSEPDAFHRSTMRTTSFTYEWTVENFAIYLDRKYEISSPEFVPDQRDGSEWKLTLFTKHIYPKGPHLAASLVKLSNDGKSHGMQYKISVISENNVYCAGQTQEKLFKNFLDFQECVVISRSVLIDQKILHPKKNPNLTIRCEIDMLLVESPTKCDSSKQHNLFCNNFSLHNLSLSNKKEEKNKMLTLDSSPCSNSKIMNTQQEISAVQDSLNCLSEDLHMLYLNKTQFDITIICNGKSIRAHKAILAARSEIFNCVNNGDQINISGVDCSVLEAVLGYMYTGKTPQLTAKLARGMLRIAKKFMLHQLEDLLTPIIIPEKIENELDLQPISIKF